MNEDHRYTSGVAVQYCGKWVWIPTDPMPGDNVSNFCPSARVHGCDYILWNDMVRGVDSKYGW